VLDALYPRCCFHCDAYGAVFCDGCRQSIRPVEPGPPPIPALTGVACVGYHEEALRAAVLKLKFRSEAALANPLGELLARELSYHTGAWKPDGLVPVPMHWTRLWDRGCNHTELLAEALGAEAGLPVHRALRRVRRTPRQLGLDAEQRRRNLHGAFTVEKKVAVDGLRLVILDDVHTTGSTLAECGATLIAAGAAEVFALTVSFQAG
jgi:ComF family protein